MHPWMEADAKKHMVVEDTDDRDTYPARVPGERRIQYGDMSLILGEVQSGISGYTTETEMLAQKTTENVF